jgi:uncharacterized heparinase superfamily protein
MKAERIPQNLKWIHLKPKVPFSCYPWFDKDRIDKGHFEFLNDFTNYTSGIDWQAQAKNRLWRYNLHYFNYLHPEGGLEKRVAIRLINDWIQCNPPGAKDAWDPFPISVRLVNWIKYMSHARLSDEEGETLRRSIYLQTLWLERSLERHLLGNHLFKNLKALVFSGLFFKGFDAERWLRKGLRLLDREIREQILPDGGHFERSPMYHSMIFEDCLDLLNIFGEKPRSECRGLKSLLTAVCPLMRDFLVGMLHPDEEIALFNDAAFGIELPPSRLLEYASCLLKNAITRLKVQYWSFSESGYYIIAPGKGDRMIIDCGAVGPDYQPGHAHCDTLSYELSLDGQRVIVDSGVYDYQNGDMRQYVRSTRAHNTIMVNGKEQSEIWSAFRVAKRAKPIHANIEKTDTHKIRFCGAHDGYKKLPGNVIHERTVEFNETNAWTIIDRIMGKRKHQVKNFIHIHPDLKVVIEGKEVQLLDRRKNKRNASIMVLSQDTVSLEKGWYCSEFGVSHENDVIILSRSEMLPIEMKYRIYKN